MQCCCGCTTTKIMGSIAVSAHSSTDIFCWCIYMLIYAWIDHFEARLTVLSEKVDSKVLTFSIRFCSLFLLSLSYKFCERYAFVMQGFTCVFIIRKRPIYTMTSDQNIPLWWAKFELECLLIIFIYFDSNSRSLAKTRTLNVDESKLISFEENKV